MYCQTALVLVAVAPYKCSQGPDVISSSGQWAPLLLVHYGYSCLVVATVTM